MAYYPLLKFAHILGFILLGGGLLAVFISELRAYRTSQIQVFAEASRYTAIFYDALAIPGALLVGVTGFFLILELELGFFTEPWVVGMWGLFLFEFVEGNTLTRFQFRKALRHCEDALAHKQVLSEDLREKSRSLLNRFVHFLDIPLFTVIVYCGTVRPESWGHVLAVAAAGVITGAVLTFLVPYLARR